MNYYLYRFFLLVLFICSAHLSILSQTLRGKVTAADGTPIPYAALYLPELNAGFTTDEQGYFERAFSRGSYTCEVSSLGYEPQQFHFTLSEKDVRQDIVLRERIYQLREVQVMNGKEDPAYEVVRKAIAYAPIYRTYVKNYTAETYLKGSGKVNHIPALLKLSAEVRRDAKKYVGKVFVMEEQRVVTFTAPNGWNNEVKAYQNSFPEEIVVGMSLTQINLYTPTLFGKISPLHPAAFSYYRFQLEGCYTEGEYLINRIRFTPKREDPELVSGYIHVIEGLWMLYASQIQIKSNGMEGEILTTCKEVQPEVFMPVSFSMQSRFQLMGFGAEASYLSAIRYNALEVDHSRKERVEGKQETAMQAIADMKPKQKNEWDKIADRMAKGELTNKEARRISSQIERLAIKPDTVIAHKYDRSFTLPFTEVHIDSLAGEKDSLYWADVRSVPLRVEELISYKEAQVDTLNDKKKTFLTSKPMQAFLYGRTFRSGNDRAWLRMYNLSSYVPEFNFADGFWTGLRLTTGIKFSESSRMEFTPELYYTTARHRWVGQGTLQFDYAPRYRGRLILQGGQMSADYNRESGESRLINSYSSLFFGRNEIKLYDSRFLSLTHQVEPANGLLFTAGFLWERRSDLSNSVGKSLFGTHARSAWPDNDLFLPLWEDNKAVKASAELSYTPAHYYTMQGSRKVYEPARYPTFTFRYERAFPLGGSTLHPTYHRTELYIQQQVRFGMFNRISWFAGAGKFWDASGLMFPDMKHFAATRLPVTEFPLDFHFSRLGNYEYSTDDKWVQAGITWQAPSLLLKQLPFLKNKSFHEALHIRTLMTHRTPYTELGYSVSRLDLLRVGIFCGFERLKFRSVGVTVSIPLEKLRSFSNENR